MDRSGRALGIVRASLDCLFVVLPKLLRYQIERWDNVGLVAAARHNGPAAPFSLIRRSISRLFPLPFSFLASLS